jgi:coproporphyrinogen III oxidase
MRIPAVRTYLLDLQSHIVTALEKIDGVRFRNDEWARAEGGGGITRILEGGEVFERAGIGFSHVMGTKLPASASTHRPQIAGGPWEAVGVSLVLHPLNPYVPTVHMNVRFFASKGPSARPSPKHTWWFGGGMDLTPYYPFEEDCAHFHRANRDALAPFPGLHARFKKACDEYFFLKHRNEPRGIGGIFFDNMDSGDWEADFTFLKDVGSSFLEEYPRIVRRHFNESWTEAERRHQLIRRGRYVEFNLLYDRGTLFGIKTGGNPEAILMSLPPQVLWP